MRPEIIATFVQTYTEAELHKACDGCFRFVQLALDRFGYTDISVEMVKLQKKIAARRLLKAGGR